MDPVLTARDLGKFFHLRTRFWDVGRSPAGFWAVRRASLNLQQGERLAVVGESGCGKSTLVRMITGFLQPTTGAVQIAGRRVRPRWLGQDLRLRRQVQIVFQEPAALLHPMVAVGLQLRETLRRQPSSRYRTPVQLATAVDLPVSCLELMPRRLSGGERRRASLAKILAAEPKLIVADEPLTGLDHVAQKQLTILLDRALRDTGAALLLVTHDLELARQLCQRVVVMYSGSMVEELPVGRFVLSHAQNAHTRDLLLAEQYKVCSADTAGIIRDTLVRPTRESTEVIP